MAVVVVALTFSLGHRPMRGGVAVQGDYPRGSMLLRRMGREPLGGSYITPFAQKKINGARCIPLSLQSTTQRRLSVISNFSPLRFLPSDRLQSLMPE
jgi:hypothetical protein